MKTKIILLFFSLVMFSSCAALLEGSVDKANKVQLGMTKEEVKKTMNGYTGLVKSSERTEEGLIEEVSYYLHNNSDQTYVFKDGILIRWYNERRPEPQHVVVKTTVQESKKE